MANTKVTGDLIASLTIATGNIADNAVTSTKISGITTAHITEGSNLYYTDARADARITAATTSDLTEGTNLYYTDARTDARVNLQTGTNLSLSNKSTSDLSEGTNLYYTDARADARAALLVDSAPSTLNTLNELAAALGDDPNFATTTATNIGLKLPLAGGTLSGFIQLSENQLRFDQSGTRSWTVSAGGGNLNINSGDSLGNVVLTTGLTVEDTTTFAGNITGTTATFTNAINNANSVNIINTGGTGTSYGLEIKAGTNATDHALQVLNKAGSNLMRVTGEGKVGVGTATPNYKMEVDGGSAETRLRISTTGTDADEAGIILANSGKVAYNDGIQIAHGAGVTTFKDLVGEVQMAIDVTNSRVGIGTTSPTTALTIRKAISPTTYGEQASMIEFKSYYTGYDTETVKSAIYSGVSDQTGLQTTRGFMSFWTADYISGGGQSLTEKMRIESNGNVGIGTTSPGAKLDVYGDGSGIAVGRPWGNDAYVSSGYFGKLANAAAGGAWNAGSAFMKIEDSLTEGVRKGTNIDFVTHNYGGGNQTTMTLSAEGNVGIGTPSPQALLDVGGGDGTPAGTQFRAVIKGIATRTLYLDSDGSTSSLWWGAGNVPHFAIDSQSGGGAAFWTYSGGWNRRMDITAAGNVGIGTTNPAAKLDIGGNTVGSVQAIFGRGNTDPAFTVRYTNGITGPTNAVQGTIGLDYGDGYWADMAAVKFIRHSTAGELAFYTSAAATSGVERMRINSSGNVGIGAAPVAGIRLRVEGGNIRCLDTYNNTTATATNMVVSSGGTFERSTSSLKYKKEVRDYDKGLDFIDTLRPVYYKGKSESDGDKQFAGLIAEEVHASGLEEFVQYAQDGSPDALAYTHMVALLVNGIKELKAEIDILKNK